MKREPTKDREGRRVARRGREIDGRAGHAGLLESLEPRVLMTTYAYQDAFDTFHLERLVGNIPAQSADPQQFGATVSALGDINGDGNADFAVGAPGVLGEGGIWAGNPGAVYLYSGRTRALIRTLQDGFAGFGSSMVNMGDLNGDGVPDLAVGSPDFDADNDSMVERFGRVAIYSGHDGTIIRSFTGTGAADRLGWAIANVGDVDHDGAADLITGAPGVAGDRGSAYVYSGRSGGVLFTFNGESAGDRFGAVVAGGTDLPLSVDIETGDGFKDYLIGAPGNDVGGPDAGRAYLFSGADGSLMHAVTGEAAGDEFGSAVAFLGGDGMNPGFNLRLVVGAPGHDMMGLADSGALYQFSVHEFLTSTFTFENTRGTFGGAQAGDRFGAAIGIAGDLDSDNTVDITVLAPGANGIRRIWALGNSPVIHSEPRALGSPISIAAIGDADGDGVRDIVVGSPELPDVTPPAHASVLPASLAFGQYTVLFQSDNARFFVVAGGAGFGAMDTYIIADGAMTPQMKAGLARTDIIQGINNTGMMFARDSNTATPVTLDRLFFVVDGQKTPLSQAITSIIGPTPNSLVLVKLSNNGDSIFSEFGSGTYLFHAGVLSFLWNGIVTDINDSGTILGTRYHTGDAFGTTVLRAPGGAVTDVPNFFIAEALNNLGVIVGESNGNLATWSAGHITQVASITPSDGTLAVTWTPLDIDDTGRITTKYTEDHGPVGRGRDIRDYYYFIEPGASPVLLDQVILGADPSMFFGSFVRAKFLGTHRIGFAGGVASSGNQADAMLQPGSPTSGAGAPADVIITGLNGIGRPVIISAGAGDASQPNRLNVDIPMPIEDIVTFVDSRDHRAYAFVRFHNQFVLVGQDAGGVFSQETPVDIQSPDPFLVPTGRHMTVFMTSDGRAVIAMPDAAGDIIIFYQTTLDGPAASTIWAGANLSLSMRNQGLADPRIIGDLTAYSTPWGAMNIAGLDVAGHIRALWWAPGLTLWRSEDLSTNAGTPALTGNITSYITSWGGTNIAGTDTDGHVVVTWWAPGLGDQWSHDDLTQEFSGLRFTPGSLGSFVTPWGALNIAGIDAASGHVSVFWWSPGGTWVSEQIGLTATSTAAQPIERLVCVVQGSNLNIFGRDENSHLIRFFWRVGDGVDWNATDVTGLVG